MKHTERILARCEEVGNCLVWQGPMNNGSPQLYMGLNEKGHGYYRQARRILYEERRGPIQSGLSPVMKCRDPRCVKFEHMALMGIKAISALACSEGKFSTAERKAAIRAGRRRVAKLTIEQVRAIRASDVSGPKIAALLGVNRTLIPRIRSGEIWAEQVPGASVFHPMRGAA